MSGTVVETKKATDKVVKAKVAKVRKPRSTVSLLGVAINRTKQAIAGLDVLVGKTDEEKAQIKETLTTYLTGIIEIHTALKGVTSTAGKKEAREERKKERALARSQKLEQESAARLAKKKADFDAKQAREEAKAAKKAAKAVSPVEQAILDESDDTF